MKDLIDTVFGYICYTEETPQGELTEPVGVEIFDVSEKSAENKALELTGRKLAKLKTITEYRPASPERPKYICTIQAFDTQVGGQLVGNVQLDMWDNDPKKAMERAKSLVTKKFYRFRQIVEKKTTE